MINDYAIKINSNGRLTPIRRHLLHSECDISGVIYPEWKWSMARNREYSEGVSMECGMHMYYYPDKSVEICSIERGEFLKPGHVRRGTLSNRDLLRSHEKLKDGICNYGDVPLVNWKLVVSYLNSYFLVGWNLSTNIPGFYNVNIANGRNSVRLASNRCGRRVYAILSQPINPAYLETVERIEIIDINYSFLAINGIPMIKDGDLWVSEKPEGECILSIKLTEDPIGPVRFRGYNYD